jgi:hypothetical protein
MKTRQLTFIFFALFAYFLFSSKRLGLASQFGMDRTGSALSGGLNCGQCHSGAANSADLTIVLKDNTNQVVTTYIPGNTYQIEANVSSLSAFTRGFQLVSLDGGNAQAGNLTNVGTQTKISVVGSRQYLEHSSPALSAGSFTFTADWIAPALATGNVTFYSAGIVGNGNSSTSGDDPTDSKSLVVSEAVMLPVELIDFRAHRVEKGINFFWKTGMEESFDKFELERSFDGREFSKIKEISAEGNYSEYQYTDQNPLTEKAYYRLRLNDFVGTYQFSQIIYMEAENLAEDINIFPNPTSGNAWIELPKTNKLYQVSWYDMNGRQMGFTTTEDRQLQIPLEALPSGAYWLRVTNSSGEYLMAKRIIKL